MANSRGSAAGSRRRSPSSVRRRPEWQRRWLNEEVILGYSLLAPAVIVLLLLVGYPALTGIWFSFHNKMIGFANPHFVGLDNYANLIQNPAVWKAIGRSSDLCRCVRWRSNYRWDWVWRCCSTRSSSDADWYAG